MSLRDEENDDAINNREAGNTLSRSFLLSVQNTLKERTSIQIVGWRRKEKKSALNLFHNLKFIYI